MQASRRGILLALAGLALVVALGGWISVGGTSSAGSPTRYVEAVVGQPLRINPLALRSNDAEGDLVALVFSGLMRITADGTPEPDLARSWEVTPDGLTYTFELRPDAVWHDGVPVTAHDVAYTIGRIQSPEFDGPSTLATQWSGAEVFVAGPWTLLIHIQEPAADFLVRAAIGIVPQHLHEQLRAGEDGAPFDRAPVGTGPYRLASLDEERAVLQRNVDYVHGVPGIEEIHLLFAETPLQQLEMLEEEIVDAALLSEQANMFEQIALSSRNDIATTLLPRSAYTILYFNNRDAPLSDHPTRRALAAAVDPVAALEQAGAQRFVPGDGVIVPQSWALDLAATDEAGEAPGEPLEGLWQAAGWVRGQDGMRARGDEPLALQLATNDDPFRVALAEAIAEQLEAEGVAVEVVTVPPTELIAEYLRAGTYQLVLFGWEAGIDPDPYAAWHSSQIGGLGGNVAAFRDVEADALLEAARTTLDVAERQELYALFGERFAERAPSVVIGYPGRLYAHPSNLQGLEAGLLFSPSSRFRDVHLWELE